MESHLEDMARIPLPYQAILELTLAQTDVKNDRPMIVVLSCARYDLVRRAHLPQKPVVVGLVLPVVAPPDHLDRAQAIPLLPPAVVLDWIHSDLSPPSTLCQS